MMKKSCKLSFSLPVFVLLLGWISVQANAQNEKPLPLPPAPNSGNNSIETPPANTEATKDATTGNGAMKSDEAVPAKDAPTQHLQLRAIAGKTPYYVDKSVTMIPIRPICDFLGLQTEYKSGVISISGTLPQQTADDAGNSDAKTENAGPVTNPIFVNFRDRSRIAQIIQGTQNRTITLPLAPETRLGVTFVPLRFVADAFGAKVSYNAKKSIITVQNGDEIGYLRQPDQCGANVKKTVRLTVVNRVGRAFTLQLKGPCNFRIELGRFQKVLFKLPAGLYQYTAMSEGAYPRHGKRWLRSNAQVNWTFGG